MRFFSEHAYTRIGLSATLQCLRRNQSPQHLLLSPLLHLIPTNPIIAIDVSTTNPPVTRERTPPMQHPPVVKDQHPSGCQLLPVLILLLLEQGIKLAGRIVPRLDFVNGKFDGRAVRAIPPHSEQVIGCGVVFQDWEAAVWLNGDAFVAGGVAVHIHC